jgi:hypothetical protein
MVLPFVSIPMVNMFKSRQLSNLFTELFDSGLQKRCNEMGVFREIIDSSGMGCSLIKLLEGWNWVATKLGSVFLNETMKIGPV